MAAQHYNTVTPRIGRLKGDILKHAVPIEVLGMTGKQHPMPKNQSDTVVFRRWLPFGATTASANTINQWVVDENAHLTQEGVTPDADSINAQDIPVTLHQYSCLYMYTDKAAELYEDNIPQEQKIQTGERMGLVREKIRYGTLKGCTNKFYAGGTSRATVDEAIGITMLRRATRNLLGNRGKLVTRILSPSANFNTAPVEAAFVVYCHTDCEHDIRELPGFKEVAAYGSRKPISEYELGSTDRYRFIVSPELSSIPDSGAAIASTGLFSTTGTLIDVYPMIVVAQDAWGDVALRGSNSFTPTHIPHTTRDKSDPHGQRGYVGAIFWSASFVQNDGWMAVIEVGVTNLA